MRSDRKSWFSFVKLGFLCVKSFTEFHMWNEICRPGEPVIKPQYRRCLRVLAIKSCHQS